MSGVSAASAANPSPAHLDLGPADLRETRTTSQLQPGVTLTRITRGEQDPSLHWVLEVQIPATLTSPDPDAPPRAISDEASARKEADRLASKGFAARIERVDQPRTADVDAGLLGYRVRVGSYPDKAAADADRARLVASGESPSSVFTGWDGARSARGPWHVDVIRIDPRRFQGHLAASYGPDLYHREATSQLAREAGATVGINGGFFVLDPASGAPGDPAGAGVYGGRVLSEPTNGRPALLLRNDGASGVDRLRWAGQANVAGRRLMLDGIDRVPGFVRNCGGDVTDSPTELPLHDTTCTDGSELVAFTPEYDASSPAGSGREVLVDPQHRVREVRPSRGATLPPGWTSLQATGERVHDLDGVAVGDQLDMSASLVSSSGRTVHPSPNVSVVNGGPLLLRDGHEDVTQRRDGFVHPGDPNFAYGWFIKRNPRTLAGVDAEGRTVLVTVDGRSTTDLGLSVPEAADVARSLGLVDAVNLDGGGSTAMAVHGQIIGHPSDATGERPVGDALLVMPQS